MTLEYLSGGELDCGRKRILLFWAINSEAPVPEIQTEVQSSRQEPCAFI